MKEYTEKDHLLIKTINQELFPIIEKYGREALQYAAMWIFEKPIAEKRMILKDKKGFEKEIIVDKTHNPIPVHRIPILPSLGCPTKILEVTDCPKPLETCEFRYMRTHYQKMDCGCVSAIFEYEEI